MPKYDIVINEEASVNSMADATSLFVHATMKSNGAAVPFINCGDLLQGGPTVLGPKLPVTYIAFESFMGKMVAGVIYPGLPYLAPHMYLP